MAGKNCVLSEEQFLCSICLEIFTDPVTTTCGHSFCNICINKHWDNSVQSQCPFCKEEFSSRPQLKTNTFMLEMISEFKNKPQGEDSEASELDAVSDVLCDFCPEPKLKALKSCLVCQTSYCPEHLMPHNTVSRLKKHQLIAPVKNLEERICPEHERPIEFICRDHSQLICVQCSYTEHRDHFIVPLKEQSEEEQHELQLTIKERQNKILELQRSVEVSQENADREIKKGEEIFNDIMKCFQESLDQFKQNINNKHQQIKEKAENFTKDLESEISVLEQRQAEMEQIFNSDDHFHFVQTFTLEKPAPELNDWTQVFVKVPSYEGRTAAAVSDLWVNKVHPKYDEVFSAELTRAKQYSVDVTLDPDTAHENLVVAPKQVQYSEDKQNVEDSPQRFTNWHCVSGKEKFSSSKFYFEVQVKGNTPWYLGVVKESADRKGNTNDMTEENGYWEISNTALSPRFAPKKVGVFVDYEEGLVCFFDAETKALIKSFKDCCFSESLLPLFSPGKTTPSVSLKITPVIV